MVAGGFYETGTIVHADSAAAAPRYTQSDTLSGNGTYTATGYTLPTTGTVAGTYTWAVSYSGDANNHPVSDNSGTTEQVTVSPASPTIVTTASSASHAGHHGADPERLGGAVGRLLRNRQAQLHAELGRAVLVHAERHVSGNGTYTAS